MNDYKALRTFLLAAEKRNFAQVARELDMTPAAVTRAIAALEEDLGVQLFVRTTRQVSLTTDGAIFAAQIRPAVQALDNARKDLMNTTRRIMAACGSARRPGSASRSCRRSCLHSKNATRRSASKSRSRMRS